MKILDKYIFLNDFLTVERTKDAIKTEHGDALGLAEIDFNKITIALKINNKRLTEQKEAETFLHEIMHNVSAAAQLSLTERQIGVLSRMLLYFLRENKVNLLDTKQYKCDR